MKFLIVVVTQESRVARFISVRQTGAIPADKRNLFFKRGITFSMKAFLARNPDCEGLYQFLANAIKGVDGLILVCDHKLRVASMPLSDAFFLATFNSMDQSSIQNFFGQIIARTLKNFWVYMDRFSDAKFQKLLLLPLQNFVADELAQIRRLFSENAASNNFANALDQNLGRLYSRRTPKGNSRFRTIYVRDDKSHYYSYGYEIHAQLESAVPPHEPTCELNGFFRFGLKYDHRRHYNVSERSDRSTISGVFINCHGEPVAADSRSHLNMFPNGFF